MSLLSVPYLALIPEMATGYDERTSLNTYRERGRGARHLRRSRHRPTRRRARRRRRRAASRRAPGSFGAWLALPWLAVWTVSFERPDFQAPGPSRASSTARVCSCDTAPIASSSALFLFGRIAST